MNVKELKEKLATLPDNLEVVEKMKEYLLGKCHADVLLELANK